MSASEAAKAGGSGITPRASDHRKGGVDCGGIVNHSHERVDDALWILVLNDVAAINDSLMGRAISFLVAKHSVQALNTKAAFLASGPS